MGNDNTCPWDDADGQKCPSCTEQGTMIKAQDLPRIDPTKLKPGDKVMYLPDDGGDQDDQDDLFDTGVVTLVSDDGLMALWSHSPTDYEIDVLSCRLLSPVSPDIEPGTLVRVREDVMDRHPSARHFGKSFLEAWGVPRVEKVDLVNNTSHGCRVIMQNYGYDPAALEYVVDPESMKFVEPKEEDHCRTELDILRKRLATVLFNSTAMPMDDQIVSAAKDYKLAALKLDEARNQLRTETELVITWKTAAKYERELLEQIAKTIDGVLGEDTPILDWDTRIAKIKHFVATPSVRTEKFETGCEEKPMEEKPATLLCDYCEEPAHAGSKGRLLTYEAWEGFYHAECIQECMEHRKLEEQDEQNGALRVKIMGWVIGILAILGAMKACM